MHPVLIIETSATLQHAARRLLKSRGYAVVAVKTYEEAWQRLRAEGAVQQYAAVILGHPLHSHPQVDQLLSLLRRPDYRELAVLIFTHTNDPTVRDWTTRRARTALLSWDDYTDCVGCLTKLLATATVHEKTFSATRDIHVLFVDDSRTVRASFKKLMHGYGYHVETAVSAVDAMEKAKNHTFDIAILDYFMPGGNGDTLCRQLREHPLTADITVAIITGTYSDEVIRDSLEAGAVECMFKNEANELFLARLAAMSRSVRARKTMEAEHQRLAGILSSVGDGVYGVNRAGQITFINPAARAILGFTSEDNLIGSAAHKLFHYANEDKTLNPPETCLLQ
ncbi:MAG: response regulator, partial [Gammaproteobacteria bacterium]|nr:response regulator [Gammaproteobacteria bacterium]